MNEKQPPAIISWWLFLLEKIYIHINMAINFYMNVKKRLTIV